MCEAPTVRTFIFFFQPPVHWLHDRFFVYMLSFTFSFFSFLLCTHVRFPNNNNIQNAGIMSKIMWRRLFLAAFGLNMVTLLWLSCVTVVSLVAVLRGSVRIGASYIIAALCDRLLWRLSVLSLQQDAQLSQRDRAAEYISFGQKWKTGTGRQYFTDIIGLSSTTVT